VPESAPEGIPAPTGQGLRVGGYLPIGGLRRPTHARSTSHPIAAAQPDAPEAFTLAAPVQAAEAVATPVQGSLTASGLPTRIPSANRIPGSPGLEQNEAPLPHGPVPPAVPSAEAVRARLSGFQRGIRRGEQQVSRAGERTDQERADH
jgi:hypothetical protein